MAPRTATSKKKVRRLIAKAAVTSALGKAMPDLLKSFEQWPDAPSTSIEQFAALLADTVPVLMWMADTTKRRIWFNKEWLQFRGRSIVQELGSGWTEGVHPEDLAHFLDTYTSAFERKEAFRIEYRLLHRSGEYRWVLSDGRPLFQDATFVGFVGGCTDIHERKLAEERAVESHALLQAVLRNITEGITVQSKQGLVFANEHAAKIIGYASVEELLATPPAKIIERFEIMDSEGRPFSMLDMPGRRVLAGEHSPPPVTLRFRVRDTGEERWSTIRAEPIYASDGTVEFAINVFQDITEERRRETMSAFLNKASTVLSSSLDHTTIIRNIAELVVPHFSDWCSVSLRTHGDHMEPVVVTHRDPKKVRWAEELRKRFPPTHKTSEGSRRVLQTGKAELYSKITIEMLVAAIDDPEYLKVVQELGMQSVMVVPIAARGRTLGVISFVSAESGRLFDATDLAFAEDLGRRIGMAIENARLYREAREEILIRQKAQEALKGSELRYRRLLEKLPAGAYTCDADGLITYFNQQAEHAWGRAPRLHDPADRYSGSFKLYFADGTPMKHDQCWMAEVLKTGKEYIGQEIIVERPDGTRLNVLAHATPLRDEAGKITGAVNILVDISERARVERSKSEFVSLASHQLRTPLTAIRWATGSLKSEKIGPLTPMQKELVEEVETCSRNMAETIGTMLMISLSQINPGRLHLDPSNVSVEELLRDVVHEQKSLYEKKQQQISVECSSALRLRTDRKVLREILSNLINNAVKYTPDGGHIRVSAEDRGRVIISVRDNGYGIPLAQQSQIFTQFFRADNVSRKHTEGTGLGLYLAHTLSRILGGGISFESQEGSGTTFTVSIPSLPMHDD